MPPFLLKMASSILGPLAIVGCIGLAAFLAYVEISDHLTISNLKVQVAEQTALAEKRFEDLTVCHVNVDTVKNALDHLSSEVTMMSEMGAAAARATQAGLAALRATQAAADAGVAMALAARPTSPASACADAALLLNGAFK